VAGISEDEAVSLAPLARKVADAETDGDAAAVATLELMNRIRSALHVQAFAALTHTLAAFLGNAWLALLVHPAGMSRLAAEPALLPDALEELLRFAGPSIAVFRPTRDGGRVMLRLAEANRDPEVFAEPDVLKLDRRPAGHLAFGAGPHACAGATLIRLAARPAIARFAACFADRALRYHAEPEEGLTIRSLRSLTIHG